MLNLTSKEISTLATGVGGFSKIEHSNAFIVGSSAVGVGLVYVGMKKKGMWHIATAVGAINLFGNALAVGKKLS